MSLTIDGLSKGFGRFPALKQISLEVRQGEFLALLGPSGSGKTTLLRILAGLEAPDRGEVRFQGQDLLALEARERRVGMVFQNYALFRHMSVAANVAFGLRVRPRRERPDAAAIRRRVEDLLRLVQLDGLGGRYPGQLSGGQRQRVALARALAIEPRLLLLDEPFGALDAKVRRDLRRWLRRLHDETGVSTIFVTHDQEEALDLADRVAILNAGALAQVGPPGEVYETPNSAFVFDFLGESCRLLGVVADGRLRLAGWETAAPQDGPHAGPVEVFFRPEDVELLPEQAAGIAARVRAVAGRGPSVRIECLVGVERIELSRPGEAPAFAAPGRLVRLLPSRPRAYPAGGE